MEDGGGFSLDFRTQILHADIMMSSPVTDEIARKHCRQLRSEDYLLLAQENKEYCRLVSVLTDREALLEQQLAHAHARILTL